MLFQTSCNSEVEIGSPVYIGPTGYVTHVPNGSAPLGIAVAKSGELITIAAADQLASKTYVDSKVAETEHVQEPNAEPPASHGDGSRWDEI
jgi:hypothetical protein